MRSRPRSCFQGLAAFAALSLCACIGGTGTDTDNGVQEPAGTAVRVLDADGNPQAGVLLALHRPDYRPDMPALEDIFDSAGSLTSDSLGNVPFRLAAPGRYVVEGSRQGVVLFFDTLAVADVKAVNVYTFLARPSLDAKGNVRLASGMRVDSGRVFVRGTGRSARIDSTGGYDLGPMPRDLGRMAVGLVYSASPREARVAEGTLIKDSNGVPGSDTTRQTYTCREVSVDSAGRIVAAAPAETAAGGPATLAPAADTVNLDAVAKSCDSVPSGTVIAVRTPLSTTIASGVKPDSSTATFLAVADAASRDVLRENAATQLVPLNCVSKPGTEATTFAVTLSLSVTGSDLLVGDVAGSCLAP